MIANTTDFFFLIYLLNICDLFYLFYVNEELYIKISWLVRDELVWIWGKIRAVFGMKSIGPDSWAEDHRKTKQKHTFSYFMHFCIGRFFWDWKQQIFSSIYFQLSWNQEKFKRQRGKLTPQDSLACFISSSVFQTLSPVTSYDLTEWASIVRDFTSSLYFGI